MKMFVVGTLIGAVFNYCVLGFTPGSCLFGLIFANTVGYVCLKKGCFK